MWAAFLSYVDAGWSGKACLLVAEKSNPVSRLSSVAVVMVLAGMCALKDLAGHPESNCSCDFVHLQ